MKIRKGITWRQLRNLVEEELRNHKIPEEQDVFIEEISIGWCDIDVSIGIDLSSDDYGHKQIAVWGNGAIWGIKDDLERVKAKN